MRSRVLRGYARAVQGAKREGMLCDERIAGLYADVAAVPVRPPASYLHCEDLIIGPSTGVAFRVRVHNCTSG